MEKREKCALGYEPETKEKRSCVHRSADSAETVLCSRLFTAAIVVRIFRMMQTGFSSLDCPSA